MLPLRSRRHATPTSGHEANAEGQQRSFPRHNQSRHALQYQPASPWPIQMPTKLAAPSSVAAS